MISPKQKKVLAFSYSRYTVLICDGAVRSGKTSLMVVAFIDWAMREFSGQRFGICGKTVGSAAENMVIPYLSRAYAKEKYTIRWRRSLKILEVRRGSQVNYFEVFGGRDESSFALIQGRTLAGVLLDEVVLMPESFVNQALARCSVDGAKFWFSCNPGPPRHWFKTKWIDNLKAHNALYLHFEMADNPSLSEATLARYRSMYTGVFYDRYVRGLWVAADGLVYPMFREEEHVVDGLPWQALQRGRFYISVDYGTVNPTSMGLWGWRNGVWYRVAEYYYDARRERRQKTDEEYAADLERLAGGRTVTAVVADPSAASFCETLRRRGWRVQRADNRVVSGIRLTAQLLKSGKIVICKGCENAVREFSLYRWDDRAQGQDQVRKEHDHAMDEMRYFAATVAAKEGRGGMFAGCVERGVF